MPILQLTGHVRDSSGISMTAHTQRQPAYTQTCGHEIVHPRGSNPGFLESFRLPSRRTDPAPQSHTCQGARTLHLVPGRSGEARLPYTAAGRKKSSATRTRTRVARVRAEYPNQLDYSGVGAAYFNIVCLESSNSKVERTESGGIRLSGDRQARTYTQTCGHEIGHSRGSSPGCADRFQLPSRSRASAPQSHASRGARTAHLVPGRSGEGRLPYTAAARNESFATSTRIRVARVRAEFSNLLDYR